MRHLISLILFGLIGIQIATLSTIVHPISAKVQHINQLQIAAMKAGLGYPGEKILNAIKMASLQTGLSQELLLSLMHSESSFKKNAISAKNYKGLLQIPQSVFYEDANTLIGARILLEKLIITKGDYKYAIVLYKGWPLNHPEGQRQAVKVLNLTRRLKGI